MALWVPWQRRRLDEDDLQEEIRSHLKMAADDRVADGADPRGAQLESLKDFGNVALTTEAARRVWTPWWLEALHDQVSDVRYAVRVLLKGPAFALTVIAVLTLGIGLNAAVFTMLKGIALSPIAGVGTSASLAVIFGETSTGRQVALSYPDRFGDIRGRDDRPGCHRRAVDRGARMACRTNRSGRRPAEDMNPVRR